MQDPADGVVDQGGVGERRVAALVGEHPKTGRGQASENGVDGPGTKSQVHIWKVSDVIVGQITGHNQQHDVPEHIVERLERSALVAVRRNGLQNVSNGIIRNVKLVSIGVDCGQLIGQSGDVASLGDRSRGGHTSGGASTRRSNLTHKEKRDLAMGKLLCYPEILVSRFGTEKENLSDRERVNYSYLN